jgi:hypothetical protein
MPAELLYLGEESHACKIKEVMAIELSKTQPVVWQDGLKQFEAAVLRNRFPPDELLWEPITTPAPAAAVASPPLPSAPASCEGEEGEVDEEEQEEIAGAGNPQRVQEHIFIGPDKSKISVGKRISVHWPKEARWFLGIVSEVSDSGNAYCVEYDDGNKRWHSCQGKGAPAWRVDDIQPAKGRAPQALAQVQEHLLIRSDIGQTGFKGVHQSTLGWYQAQCTTAPCCRNLLGRFGTPEQAALAYLQHQEQEHPDELQEPASAPGPSSETTGHPCPPNRLTYKHSIGSGSVEHFTSWARSGEEHKTVHGTEHVHISKMANTGYIGVKRCSSGGIRDGRFKANCSKRPCCDRHLGQFTSIEAAARAYSRHQVSLSLSVLPPLSCLIK